MRGQTVYNIGLIERDAKTGKLHYHGLIQLDHKVSIPPYIMNKMLPSKIKDWNSGVINHYKNHFGNN